MKVKDVFDRSENGTLTYEQFLQLAGDAKFEDIAEGKYYSKGKHADEIAAKDGEIKTLNETIAQRDTDLLGLQEQLKAVGADAEKVTEITKQLEKLQGKYNSDMQKYQDQLQRQSYEFAVKEFANETNFTSKAAKRDFINSMLAKNLTMEDGKIIGAYDFVESYMIDNEDAFLIEEAPTPSTPEQQPQPTPPEPKPHFVGSTQGEGGKKMSLSELMAAKNENPDLVVNFD